MPETQTTHTANGTDSHCSQANAVTVDFDTDADIDIDLGLDSNGDTTKVSVTTNPLEKQIIEALCYEFFDTSQSAGLKHAAVQAYFNNAGNIHPGAVLSDAAELEEVTADAILAGEVDADDLPEEYRLDGDSDAFDLENDQDNRGRANSYTPTFTPDDLASEGRALTWDELKDSVRRHWGPDLEIHPDRVKAERLKQNRKFNAKVIAGILRSQNDVVPHALIDDRIEEYLGHQITRADQEAGLEFKIERHKPLIVEHLEAHPNVKIDVHFSSKDAVERNLPDYAEGLIDDLESNTAPRIDQWREDNPGDGMAYTNEFELFDDWHDQLAEFREDLLKLTGLFNCADHNDVLEEHIDYDETEHEDVGRYFYHIFEQMKQEYKNAPAHARYVVWNEYTEDIEGELPCDQTTDAIMDFARHENDDGRMELADRFEIVGKNLNG